MATYDLNELQGGLVILCSGRWQWYAIRLYSLPDNEVVLQHLFFAHVERDGGVMRTRVDASLNQLDDDAVIELARHPEERSFKIGPREYVVRPPTNSEHDPMWRVHASQGRPYRTDVATETPLGELTRADLEKIAAAAS